MSQKTLVCLHFYSFQTRLRINFIRHTSRDFEPSDILIFHPSGACWVDRMVRAVTMSDANGAHSGDVVYHKPKAAFSH